MFSGKNSMIVLFVLSCVFLLMMGCEPEPISYTLTIQIKGEGTVEPSEGSHSFEDGTLVYLAATPADGHLFEEWIGDVVDAGSTSTTVLMNKDQIVKAVFKEFNDHVIEFEDENLEQAVREAIDKLEGDLHKSDVIGLKELDARGRGIMSLEGIHHLHNLKRVDLGRDGDKDTNNYIEDISPLENLTSLEWLDFWWNQVLDISPLENLTSLERLNFGWNQVLDISPLENLTSLERLYLQDNQVSNITPLEKLTSLRDLNLGKNQVLDISPLENLTSLERLYLFNNQVSDINPLQNLTSLERLHFSGNQVSNITSLQYLTSLERLYFSRNQVSNISPLQNLTSLRDLHFDWNQMSDINPLVANVGFGLGDKIDIGLELP